MESALVIGFVVVAIAIALCSRRVRHYLMMIALRDFYDKYMKRPRYRAYNLREESHRPEDRQ